jgi:hypothetical protein
VSASEPGQAARDTLAGQDYAAFIRWWEAKGYLTDLPLDFSDAHDAFASGMRAARDLAAALKPKPAPDGEPLTHFFHCWRFPDHHACAVALIERQQEENDALLVGVAAAERKLADDVKPAPELADLRDLLDEIGVMAANAPEDGDSFGVLEQIAMRIAAADVPDSTPAAGQWTVTELSAALDRFYGWFTVAGSGARVQGQLLGADAGEFARVLHAGLESARAHRE